MPKKKILKKRVARKRSQADGDEFSLKSLRQSLKNKTKAELLDMIVDIVGDHDSVWKQFEKEFERKAAHRSAQKAADSPEKLLEQAKKLIEKGTKIDRSDPYFKKVGFGGPKLHLEPVSEVVRLLGKINTKVAFSAIQEITKRLLERGKHYFDESWGAETAFV